MDWNLGFRGGSQAPTFDHESLDHDLELWGGVLEKNEEPQKMSTSR
jgi:hypothetical protein